MGGIIAFLCKENLNVNRFYTEQCKANVRYWSKFTKVYVYTNNPGEFYHLPCETILTNSVFSPYDKFEVINSVYKLGERRILLIDCDICPQRDFRLEFNFNAAATGIHYYNEFNLTWKELQELSYFKVWKNHIDVPMDFKFPTEELTLFILDEKWPILLDRIYHYREVAKENEKEYKLLNLIDENPHHGEARCESIAYSAACMDLNIPLHRRSRWLQEYYETLNNI